MSAKGNIVCFEPNCNHLSLVTDAKLREKKVLAF
jgi:hypothetical protein